MLTAPQYINLWTNVMGMPIQNIPCYYQYLQREIYFQDYLDLFCCPPNGNPTYGRLKVGNHDTILLPFKIDPNPSYTIPFNNQDRLIVDYDYPYTKELCKKRLIEYILIGEAPPAPFIPRIKGGLDLDNSYFYNLTHKKSTSYYNEPLKAWDVARVKNGALKTNELIDLANRGVILLDLFPFAITFSTEIRKNLNRLGITMDFWENTKNPYSIANRISDFNNPVSPCCLDKLWDLSLIAPPLITSFIVDPVNNFLPINVPSNPGAHPTEFRTLYPHPDRYNRSDYRKIAICNNSSKLYGPIHDLIRLSF